MKATKGLVLAIALVFLGVAINATTATGQGGRGQGQGQGRGQVPAQSQNANIPENPVAVPIPMISAQVTGPGTIYESVQSLAPGKDLAHFKYEAKEYFVSGGANGQPYKTRIVVRKPSNNAVFSGLILVEAMHPSGSAHMFEYTSIYTMTSGHAAVEIVTAGQAQIIEHNRDRYQDLKIEQGQANEILAQVGALIRSNQKSSPFAGLPVRKMVLAGTSATAGILIQYLPAHMVYRTPEMQRIYDGFMPTSNGATIRQIDVPLVQVPTMHEVRNANVTARQDGDQAGDQFRLYEFAGMGHVDTRDNVRLRPNPCKLATSNFPLQAYMSVALHHLFQWVDKGTLPPRADRIWKDRNESNDGSSMVLDEHGNARGGIRNPYVDVPTAKYGVPNEGAVPLIPNPSAYVAARGQTGANQMCGLGGYQVELSKTQLKQLYGNKQVYRSRVEKRLTELERAGWSLPMYREMILADAGKVEF